MSSSNEFAALVNQLHRSPNDPVLKQAVIQHLPEIIDLTQKKKPMALYHLAHIYPPTSSQYKQTMREAANSGCTNAMLVMCQMLGKSTDTHELRKAAHYIAMIDKSEDLYIQTEAKLILEEYPLLARIVEEQAQTEERTPVEEQVLEQAKPNLSYGLTHRFFTPQREREESVEFIETATYKG